VRFLPPRLTRIVVYYIILVYPIYRFFNIELLENPIDTPLLFEDLNKEISASIISKHLKALSSRFFNNKGFSLAPYRHLSIFIIKDRILAKRIDLLDKQSLSSKKNKIEDIMANHSSYIAEISYSRTLESMFTKSRSIYTRSKEFIDLYFKFFDLNKDLEDIETTLARIRESTTLELPYKDYKLEVEPPNSLSNTVLDKLDEEIIRENDSDINLELSSISSNRSRGSSIITRSGVSRASTRINYQLNREDNEDLDDNSPYQTDNSDEYDINIDEYTTPKRLRNANYLNLNLLLLAL